MIMTPALGHGPELIRSPRRRERWKYGKLKEVTGKGNGRWGFFEVSEVMCLMGFRDLPTRRPCPLALLGQHAIP